MRLWGKDHAETIAVLQEHTRAHHDEIQKLRDRVHGIENKPPCAGCAALTLRLEALELWRAQLHKLLVTETPATGKEKLSARGRGLQALYGNR